MHRVQRVPATEAQGRIHTSTATVAVLPEAEEVDIEIDREGPARSTSIASSGPGGQSVNTTDSRGAHHAPADRPGRARARTRGRSTRTRPRRCGAARAAARDRAAAPTQERGDARRTQVGTGERSEKIRTYNFPQDRVTDHRIGLTVHNLPGLLEGDLDRLVDPLAEADQAARLSVESPHGVVEPMSSSTPAPLLAVPEARSLMLVATDRLRAAGSPSPRLDAELLVAHALRSRPRLAAREPA